MIDSISSSLLGTTSSSSATGASSGTAGGFDAALAAAQKDAERKQAKQSDFDQIRDKGFSAWARDTQMEKLKEKLRQKVMAEMGVDDQSLNSLSSVMREILEQKIQEEVEKRMTEETAKASPDNGNNQAQAQAQMAAAQPGKNDRSGKDVPVISAVSWPGAPSLF